MEPCQPSDNVLKSRKKQIGSNMRHCTQKAFFHDNGVRRKWISYSLSSDAVFCVPCLLFTDETSQHNTTGTAFVREGFSNWKKQNERICGHEKTIGHKNAKIAAVLILENSNLESLLDKQSKAIENARLKELVKNRELLKRIIDVIILLGKLGIAFRGHRENMADEDVFNNGIFLELVKLLGKYDEILGKHVEKVRKDHEKIKSDAKQKVGRGNKVTFMSKNTQNKLIDIIGNEIVNEIVGYIENCIGWSMMIDTTPDVARKEQLSICVRVVSKEGEISEHIFALKEADSVTARGIFDVIVKAFESKAVSFEQIVAQTYDGASNMSGCYNGLQAIVKEEIGNFVIYVHCYAHCLNLVLKDSVESDKNVVVLFENLESLHNVVNRCMKIHKKFVDEQKASDLDVLSISGVQENFV